MIYEQSTIDAIFACMHAQSSHKFLAVRPKKLAIPEELLNTDLRMALPAYCLLRNTRMPEIKPGSNAGEDSFWIVVNDGLPIKLDDMAKKLKVSYATAQRWVKALREAGWIRTKKFMMTAFVFEVRIPSATWEYLPEPISFYREED